MAKFTDNRIGVSYMEQKYKWGNRSRKVLATLHPDWQRILNEAIKWYDISLLEGYRGKNEQNEAYELGRSKLKFPQSKHNRKPSLAVDLAPYPIDWKDLNRFRSLVFFIQGIAAGMGINVICGIDWNGDLKANESFVDAPH
ncbi:MAG: hypothetical protein R6V32_11950, partial [Bacteroidales bacterium]